MRLTLFCAMVTATLNVAGVHQGAEITHTLTSILALTYGGRAITRASRTLRSAAAASAPDARTA